VNVYWLLNELPFTIKLPLGQLSSWDKPFPKKWKHENLMMIICINSVHVVMSIMLWEFMEHLLIQPGPPKICRTDSTVSCANNDENIRIVLVWCFSQKRMEFYYSSHYFAVYKHGLKCCGEFWLFSSWIHWVTVIWADSTSWVIRGAGL